MPTVELRDITTDDERRAVLTTETGGVRPGIRFEDPQG